MRPDHRYLRLDVPIPLVRTAGSVCGLLLLPELLTRRRPRDPAASVDVHDRGLLGSCALRPPGPALLWRRSERGCCRDGEVGGNRTLLADMVPRGTLGRPRRHETASTRTLAPVAKGVRRSLSAADCKAQAGYL